MSQQALGTRRPTPWRTSANTRLLQLERLCGEPGRGILVSSSATAASGAPRRPARVVTRASRSARVGFHVRRGLPSAG